MRVVLKLKLSSGHQNVPKIICCGTNKIIFLEKFNPKELLIWESSIFVQTQTRVLIFTEHRQRDKALQGLLFFFLAMQIYLHPYSDI